MFVPMLVNMLKEEVGWSNFLVLIFEAWQSWKQIQLGEVAASDRIVFNTTTFSTNKMFVWKSLT